MVNIIPFEKSPCEYCSCTMTWAISQCSQQDWRLHIFAFSFWVHGTMHVSLLCVLFLQLRVWVLSEWRQTDQKQWEFWSCCLFLWEPGDLSDCPSFVAMSLQPITNNRLRGAQQGTATHSTPKPASRPASQHLDSSLCVGGHRRILLPFENVQIIPQKMDSAGGGAFNRPLCLGVGIQISLWLLSEMECVCVCVCVCEWERERERERWTDI